MDKIVKDGYQLPVDGSQLKTKNCKPSTVNRKLSLFVFCCLFFTFSCSHMDIERDIQIPSIHEAEKAKIKDELLLPPPLPLPPFVPVVEVISPLEMRFVDIVARDTPLKDVLHVIAEVAELNLVMKRGVNPEFPITLTLRNVSVKDALNAIFLPADYFYEIKDNMLIVKAVDTRIFEFGHPAIIQAYGLHIGGDVLGAAEELAPAGIRGEITLDAEADPLAFDFWGAIEALITKILEVAPIPDVEQGFVINRMAGIVVVTASKRNIKRVENALNAIIGVMNRQVLIEAKIVEVQLFEEFRYGIDWELIGGGLRFGIDHGFRVGAETFAGVVAPALPAIAMAIETRDFDLALRALRKQGELRTLSNPRVKIMHGQAALLNVGRTITFIAEVETVVVEDVVTYTVETATLMSGMMLGIVPFIDEHDMISLTITPIISDLVDLPEKEIGEIRITLPIVDIRKLSTTVEVMDGQTIVIGGLISERERVEEHKVPLLGDLPLLGRLFTRMEKEEIKTELVIILQPTLVSR